MIVIRRMVDRRRAYTAIFLPGEPPKIFPTNDAEHARILQVYKQDRLHADIINDFSELAFPSQPAEPTSTGPRAAPAPWPLASSASFTPRHSPPALPAAATAATVSHAGPASAGECWHSGAGAPPHQTLASPPPL
jgi:hypothetical protein